MNSSACWSIEWSVKSGQENYTGADLRWINEFGIDQIPERHSNLKTSVGFSSSVEDLVPSLALANGSTSKSSTQSPRTFWFKRPYEKKKYFTVPSTTCLVKFLRLNVT